tara:strand:+ start:372 stop:710 length:339 start_codon:yes stop_codon:yes gene_type:complete
MKSIEYYDKKIETYREKYKNATSPRKERYYNKKIEKYIAKRNIIEGEDGTQNVVYSKPDNMPLIIGFGATFFVLIAIAGVYIIITKDKEKARESIQTVPAYETGDVTEGKGL